MFVKKKIQNQFIISADKIDKKKFNLSLNRDKCISFFY